MPYLHIANYYEADRRSARAGEAMGLGNVIKIVDDGVGGRKALKVALVGDITPGAFGVVYKVSADPLQVSSSTASTDAGKTLQDHIVSIASGDQVVEVRRGAILEYSADLLDASLDPAEGGTTPSVGQVLGVKNAKWCNTGAASALVPTTPVAKVYRKFGTRVLVELL